MLRTLFDLVLLALGAALMVVGTVTYPAIPGGVLAATLAVGGLLLLPAGRRAAAAVAS